MEGRTTYGENTTCDFKESVERRQPKSWDLNEVPSKRRNPILADVFTQF